MIWLKNYKFYGTDLFGSGNEGGGLGTVGTGMGRGPGTPILEMLRFTP